MKRKKKTPEQIEYLRTLFDQLGGEWDKKVRKEAMQKTGLSRIQVYKWFFDMKPQQKPKEKRVEPEVRVSYPPAVVNAVSTKDLEADNFVPPAIFKIEKVVRKWSEQNAGFSRYYNLSTLSSNNQIHQI